MKRILCILLVFAVSFLLLQGCTRKEDLSSTIDETAYSPSTIGEAAFDSGHSGDHIVYVRENEEYVPYIVVTKDYQGLALLLRKNVLDILHIYNPVDKEGDMEGSTTYYPDSDIRIWLESSFLNILDAPVETVQLEVTSLDALNHGHPRSTKQIESKVFLLSVTEVNYPGTSFVREGNELDMFERMDESRVAFTKDGSSTGWWLRTPDISLSASIYAVGGDGTVGSAGIYTIGGVTALGVRPAFCIKTDTKVVERENILYLQD